MPEQLVVVDQRHGHRRADALHDDRVRGREAAVHRRVGRQHRRLVGDDLVQDRFRQDDLFVLAVAGLGDLGRRNAVLHQQDHAAIGGEQLERLHDDLLEQQLEVDLEADRSPELVGEAELLVVAAQHLDVEDLFLGQELARRRRRLDLLANQRVAGRRRDRHLLQHRFLRRFFLKCQAGRTEHDLVVFLQDVLVHALAAQERSVQAAEIAEQVAPVGLAHDLGVLLGDDAVENLERVVGMAPDRIDGPELELASLIVACDDDLGHAAVTPGKRHHTRQALAFIARKAVLPESQTGLKSGGFSRCLRPRPLPSRTVETTT